MIRAGRRGGKTTGAALFSVDRMVEKHRRVLYAVPTVDQATRFWFEVVQSLAEPIEFGIYKKYESDKIIERPGTEERIRAKTAWNADTLRGDYADVLILDEYQLMNEDAWHVVGLPMLMDNNGTGILIYTPPSLHSRSASKADDKRHAAKMFKKCQSDPLWLCLHFTSHDNPNISKEGIEAVSAGMTEIARRQEIEAEDIDEVPGALWKQSVIENTRVTKHPELIRIVIGVDPSGGSETEVGIVVAGLGTDGHGYLLADESMLAPSPKAWAARVTWAYSERKADRIVGETNYGGDMVETTVKLFDDNMSYKAVKATRGKLVRAEPICALYERGYIHHVGIFPALEEEMVSYVPGNKSPNRMDAMVWCFTELFPENKVLGLAEYYKQEEDAEVQKAAESKAPPVTAKDQCPKCGSVAVVRRGPLTHCNSCGEEWGGPPKRQVEASRTFDD